MSWTNWEKTKFNFTDLLFEKKFLNGGGGVARVAINRPKSFNAFTGHTLHEMAMAIDDADHDPMIGAIILTGVGDHFGTGGDVNWETEGGLRLQFMWNLPPNQLWRMSRKPIIAQIKGFCIGGHNHVAYCCDMSIAADNSIFGQNGPRVASPADGYQASYATRVVGSKKAREMWMTCRRYSAHEALRMGLVNKVVPLRRLEEEVDKWCEEILSGCPPCIEILKYSFDQEIDYMIGSAYNIQRVLYPDFFDSEYPVEAGDAFKNKRAPNFWAIRKRKAEEQKMGAMNHES